MFKGKSLQKGKLWETNKCGDTIEAENRKFIFCVLPALYHIAESKTPQEAYLSVH